MQPRSDCIFIFIEFIDKMTQSNQNLVLVWVLEYKLNTGLKDCSAVNKMLII